MNPTDLSVSISVRGSALAVDVSYPGGYSDELMDRLLDTELSIRDELSGMAINFSYFHLIGAGRSAGE